MKGALKAENTLPTAAIFLCDVKGFLIGLGSTICPANIGCSVRNIRLELCFKGFKSVRS